MRFFKNMFLKNLVFVIASTGIFQACKTLDSMDRNSDSEIAAADTVTAVSVSEAVQPIAIHQSNLAVSLSVPANDLMIASCVQKSDLVAKKTTLEFLDKDKKRKALLVMIMQVLPVTNGGAVKIKMTVTADITGASSESGTVILSPYKEGNMLELPTGDLAKPSSKSLKILKLVTEAIDG